MCLQWFSTLVLAIFHWIYMWRFYSCFKVSRCVDIKYSVGSKSFEDSFQNVSITKCLNNNRNRNQIKWAGLSTRQFCSFFVFTGTGKITLPILSFARFPCSLMKHTAVSVVNKVEHSFPLENFFMPSDDTHSILWKICTVLFGGKLAPLFSPNCKALS